jgi:hypothetical protein
MKSLFVITLFVSLHVAGQQIRTDERAKIYQHIILTHIGKENYVINETFTPVNKYDIDGNYQRWFSQPFDQSKLVCVNPIKYESTVLDFLRFKEVQLDTGSIFRQIETSVLDSLSKYGMPVKLIPVSKAPLRHSFLTGLFKKKSAVALSPIYFDKGNQIAFVKLQVYSKDKQSVNHPSKIILLQKKGEEWKTLGVLQETQPLTQVAVAQQPSDSMEK